MITETELLQKKFEMDMRESNLHEMQKILHEKYKQLEQFQCLASPDTVSKHEAKLDGIAVVLAELKTEIKNHLKSDDKTQELIEKLFDRAEMNSSRISILETQRNSFVWFIGFIGSIVGAVSGIIADKLFK